MNQEARLNADVFCICATRHHWLDLTESLTWVKTQVMDVTIIVRLSKKYWLTVRKERVTNKISLAYLAQRQQNIGIAVRNALRQQHGSVGSVPHLEHHH